MKRFLLVILACACIFCLSACGDSPDQPEDTSPQTTEAPATEAPATEAPATEAPATEAPATEAPATDAPATEAPATDAPETDAPATEAPATEAPATEAPATEAPATDAPLTQPNNVYVGGALSFEYPAEWEISAEGSVTILMDNENPTANISVLSEPIYEHYEALDKDAYIAQLVPAYEASGITVVDIAVDFVENENGAKITFVKLVAEMYGLEMDIAQLMANSNSKTYLVTITDMTTDDKLLDMVLNSIVLSEEEEISSPEVTAENVISVDGLSFEYPAQWVKSSDGQAIDNATGNNVNIVSESKNTFYDTIDAQTYIAATQAFYDASGVTIRDVTVEHLENAKSVGVVEISFTAEMYGVSMKMTQFVVHSGDQTYTVTVTEVYPVDGLADAIFNSITVK